MTDLVETRSQYLRRGRVQHRRLQCVLGVFQLGGVVFFACTGSWLWVALTFCFFMFNAHRVFLHPMGRDDS